jgi:hypothetical protein
MQDAPRLRPTKLDTGEYFLSDTADNPHDMFKDDIIARAQFDNMLRPHYIDQLQSNAQYLIKDIQFIAFQSVLA